MEAVEGIAIEEPPAEFLERCIFPVLLPGLEKTLRAAKSTERRKRFNPLDYLSAYLFRNNPNQRNREDISFEDIPFVKAEWAVCPRPPLPLSATLTEDEAATKIQAYFRGYLVRKDPYVVEFRKWQKKVRLELDAIRKIQRWWRRILRSDGYSSRVRARPSIPVITVTQYDEEERDRGHHSAGDGAGKRTE